MGNRRGKGEAKGKSNLALDRAEACSANQQDRYERLQADDHRFRGQREHGHRRDQRHASGKRHAAPGRVMGLNCHRQSQHDEDGAKDESVRPEHVGRRNRLNSGRTIRITPG